jgi:hypothetical protein
MPIDRSADYDRDFARSIDDLSEITGLQTASALSDERMIFKEPVAG